MEYSPWGGALIALNAADYVLFSSDADTAAMLALVQEIDPKATAIDGNGMLCPFMKYGDDGRKINVILFTATVNGVSISSDQAVGVLMAQRQWGAAWNGGNQPQYGSGKGGGFNALTFQSDRVGGVELNWWYNPAGPSTLPPTPVNPGTPGPIETVA